MLKNALVKNFTVFREVDFQFSPSLNVIVGENGTGKSHLLKLVYTMIVCSVEAGRKPDAPLPTKTHLQKSYGEKLIAVFRPESLGRLASRRQGRTRCEIALSFDDEALNTAIGFATNAQTDVQISRLPTRWEQQNPLYLPTRELLTVYPGFVSVYDKHYLEIEETWRDTCVHLDMPPMRGPRSEGMASLIEPIEEALGGRVDLDRNGRFYLNVPGSGNMEMNLVAEGSRKLAMLARLIVNGVIQAQGYLFWDEPEANLNAKLIRLVAKAIHALSARGVQVFIATHSLFLLRELEILLEQSRTEPVRARFFGLSPEDNGVRVMQGDHIDDIGDITALEESLLQSDRYLALEG